MMYWKYRMYFPEAFSLQFHASIIWKNIMKEKKVIVRAWKTPLKESSQFVNAEHINCHLQYVFLIKFVKNNVCKCDRRKWDIPALCAAHRFLLRQADRRPAFESSRSRPRSLEARPRNHVHGVPGGGVGGLATISGGSGDEACLLWMANVYCESSTKLKGET